MLHLASYASCCVVTGLWIEYDDRYAADRVVRSAISILAGEWDNMPTPQVDPEANSWNSMVSKLLGEDKISRHNARLADISLALLSVPNQRIVQPGDRELYVVGRYNSYMKTMMASSNGVAGESMDDPYMAIDDALYKDIYIESPSAQAPEGSSLFVTMLNYFHGVFGIFGYLR